MATIYSETPHNYASIGPYIISDLSLVAKELLRGKCCYFYDTCAFRRHANNPLADKILEYIKRTDGVIVLIRTILMELASHSGTLNQEYIDYIKKIHSSNIKILLLDEERLFDVLNLCFNSQAQINSYLGFAIHAAKIATGTVGATLKNDKKLRKDIYEKNATDKTLYQRFFKNVRGNKESGDNLGEEMICICVHILSNLPFYHSYRYMVLTEDKGAIGLVNKTGQNVYDYTKQKTMSALSIARLAQLLFEEGIVTTQMEVEGLLMNGGKDVNITIFASERYDLSSKEKTMTCSELADMILKKGTIHINY